VKRNRLITFIVIAMVAGVVAGFVVNRVVHTSAYSCGYPAVEKMALPDPQKKEIVTQLKNYEQGCIHDSLKKYSSWFSVLSDIFLHLIKMIIAPLVFAVLVTGVAKAGDFRSVGRIGLRTIIYFTCATLLALMLGLLLVNLFRPGDVMHLDKPPPQQSLVSGTQTAKNFIDHVIPESVLRSMAANDILPIVVFSIFFGIAAAAIGDAGKPVLRAVDSLSHVMFRVTDFVMKFAPVGIFGALAAVVTMQGLDILSGYLYLIACFFGGLLFFVFVVLFLICLMFRIRFFRLLRDIQEAVLLAFSTASSESAMPRTIEALEKHGISNRIVSFVLPLGYSFNLDGSIMYMTFATMFIAQSYGIQINAAGQIKMMLILMVTSKGMAGVPRASLVVIAGMLATFNIPGEGLLLLLAVDQILDMGRSATNVVGNAVASAVVARLEGEKF
jgi:Na+/H+-dicarboxylate symporter